MLDLWGHSKLTKVLYNNNIVVKLDYNYEKCSCSSVKRQSKHYEFVERYIEPKIVHLNYSKWVLTGITVFLHNCRIRAPHETRLLWTWFPSLWKLSVVEREKVLNSIRSLFNIWRVSMGRTVADPWPCRHYRAETILLIYKVEFVFILFCCLFYRKMRKY